MHPENFDCHNANMRQRERDNLVGKCWLPESQQAHTRWQPSGRLLHKTTKCIVTMNVTHVTYNPQMRSLHLNNSTHGTILTKQPMTKLSAHARTHTCIWTETETVLV